MRNAQPRPPDAQQHVELHTIKGAAERLGCSEMHVYRLVAAGLIRAVDIASPGAGRSKTRIRSDDLADYIERQTRGRATAVAGPGR
jgi:excisionase family DNA binding protein